MPCKHLEILYDLETASCEHDYLHVVCVANNRSVTKNNNDIYKNLEGLSADPKLTTILPIHIGE